MKIKILLLAALAALCLTGCAESSLPMTELGYVDVSQLPVATAAVNPIRGQALQETAVSLGAQGALAWRANQINTMLDQQYSNLDHIFNFNQLMLPHNVLPPVLVQSSGDLTQDDADTLRLSDKTYKILAPARFVTTPPTWRDYLWLNFQKPAIPDQTLLPQNQQEAVIWNQFLKQGWQQGLDQANQIFSANLNRLKRDYTGMILYRQLYAQHMVSAPFVAQADLGITGNSKELRINDQILRITAHSQLQTNANEWTPVLQNQQQNN